MKGLLVNLNYGGASMSSMTDGKWAKNNSLSLTALLIVSVANPVDENVRGVTGPW